MEILTSPEVGAALTQLAIAVVTGVIAVVGREARAYLKAHTTKEQEFALRVAVNSAIDFAEKTGLDKTGAEKLSAATAYVQAYVDRTGVKVSSAEIVASIEAALLRSYFPEPELTTD